VRHSSRHRRQAGHEQLSGTDAKLLAAIRDERLDALRVLHERHAPWLKARLSRRCADQDAVDTAIQETFVAVWRGAARYRARDADAGAWLWTIAIRKLISVLRGRGTRWIGHGDELGEDHTTTQSGRGPGPARRGTRGPRCGAGPGSRPSCARPSRPLCWTA